MAIQAYNMGGGSLDKILRTCSSYTNQSTDEIKQNTNNLDWLDYRYVIDRGNKYVEKVLSWIGSNIDITCIKTNGERVTINVNNEINKVY